jgi:hypothetical protein
VLDEGPARQLFRRAAGLEGGLDPRLQGLEEAILRICGGLPLALQLLGGQLYKDKEVASWQVTPTCSAQHRGSPALHGCCMVEGIRSWCGTPPVPPAMQRCTFNAANRVTGPRGQQVVECKQVACIMRVVPGACRHRPGTNAGAGHSHDTYID